MAIDKRRMDGALAGAALGAVGGVIGAACMTVIRLIARRAGVIDKMVSQAAEELTAARGRGLVPRHPVAHHIADQAMHLAYGAAQGAVYGAAFARSSRVAVPRGAAFGVASWLLGSWLLMPRMGAKRPPWRSRAPENAVDLLAHATFGLVTALVADEMAHQENRGPTSNARRWLERIG
jgi:hypothetical protein